MHAVGLTFDFRGSHAAGNTQRANAGCQGKRTGSLELQNINHRGLKTRCQIGGLGWPPEVIMSTTNEAESLEVTKKTATTMAAKKAVI